MLLRYNIHKKHSDFCRWENTHSLIISW